MFIEDSLENSMTPFKTSVVFGCVAYGAGGFHCHLTTTVKPRAPKTTSQHVIDNVVEDFSGFNCLT